MVPAARSNNDVCSYVSSKLERKRASSSSITGNYEILNSWMGVAGLRISD